MADIEFDDFDDGFDARGASSRFLGVAGALTSIALVAGLGYWGYKLAVRDMTGIPVVRALEGPMRIAPQDPGGEISAHQGLSVNSVAAEGATSRPADRLILAPRPVELTEQDAAGTAVTASAPVSAQTATSPGLEIAAPPVVEEPEKIVAINLDNTSDIDAIAEALAEGAIPLTAQTEDISATDAAPVISLPKGALTHSLRPVPRPPLETIAASSKPQETTETDGTELAAGTRLVQLGAFDSPETARDEWGRLSGKFSDLLAGKTRIVQSAKSGGRTFYRLRAQGFADDAESRRFCSALISENAACIPVAVR